MSVIGPDCSCGGHNPNCFRCDGGGARPLFPAQGVGAGFRRSREGQRTRLVVGGRNQPPGPVSRLASPSPLHPQPPVNTGASPLRTPCAVVSRRGAGAYPPVVIACHKPAGRSTQQCLEAVSRSFPNIVSIGTLERHETGLLLFTNHHRLATWLTSHAQRIYRLQVEGTVSSNISRRVAALRTGSPCWRSADIGRVRAGRGLSDVIAILPLRMDNVQSLFRALGHPITIASVVSLANVDVAQVSPNHFRSLRVEELEQAFSAFPGWTALRSDFGSVRSSSTVTRPPSRRSAPSGSTGAQSRRRARTVRSAEGDPDDVSGADHHPRGILRRREGFNSLGQYFRDITDTRDWMDATRGMHAAREHGRFGSHPIHDRFDDESMA